jgi:uncharacterized protein YegJ (DUF2314 family)
MPSNVVPFTDRMLVPPADAALASASRAARRTVGRFLARVAELASMETQAAIKVSLVLAGQTEFVWATHLTAHGNWVSGLLASDVVGVGGPPPGTDVAVGADLITDWMLVEGGVVYGAYTTHALRRRLAPAERVAFDMAFAQDVGVPLGEWPRDLPR